MTCVFHSRDLDGIACGAIMQKRFPEATMIGYDYGEPIPVINLREDLYIADVCFPVEDMIRISDELTENGATLYWIDHHIAQYKEYTKLAPMGTTMQVLYSSHQAACELCWEFFFPKIAIPEAVTLLGKYDSWRNQNKEEWDNRILPFQYGFRVHCNKLEDFPKGIFISTPTATGYHMIQETIKEGRAVFKYQRMQNERVAQGAFEAGFMGFKAICMNTTLFNSDAFKSVWDPQKYDIMMPFMFRKNQWVVSIYTEHDHVDCSELAKCMGGGGHRKAAGFQVKDITTVFPQLK